MKENLICNFVISHNCSTNSSLPKGHHITNSRKAVHWEGMGIHNLAKKGHHITNDANAVHSETMSVYNLAKKGHHITRVGLL